MGKRLTAILEAMEDGIYVVSGDFFLEFMNKSMVRDFGKGVEKNATASSTGWTTSARGAVPERSSPGIRCAGSTMSPARERPTASRNSR